MNRFESIVQGNFIVDWLKQFVDDYHRTSTMLMISLNDSIVQTMVVGSVEHSMMHLNISRNCQCQQRFVEMVRVVLGLMIQSDGGNWIEQDDWLLAVLVHVLLLFVDAIQFADFGTMSKSNELICGKTNLYDLLSLVHRSFLDLLLVVNVPKTLSTFADEIVFLIPIESKWNKY